MKENNWDKLTREEKELLKNHAKVLIFGGDAIKSLETVIGLSADVSCIPEGIVKKIFLDKDCEDIFS